MFRKLEVTYTRWIRKEPKGFFAGFVKAWLHILSWHYRVVIIMRNWLFDHGWLKQYAPPVPVVVSVGNIVSGGTGKTPTTQMIAEAFYADYQIAILSRGYRSKMEKNVKAMILCKGKGPLHAADYCGDEPYLLAKNLPKSFVYVGKNRQAASNMAAKDGAQIIVLDDGMQHRYLARDLEVVVMDAQDPFGQGYFLPRGFLREGLDSLARADLIVVNHAECAKRFSSIAKQVEHYTCAPVVGTVMEVEHIYDFNDEVIESIEGKKIALFCAIANPDHFTHTLETMGGDIVARQCLSDHRSFSKHDLERFSHKAKEKGAEILLCTEKDRVKFTHALDLALPVGWLKMRLRLVEGDVEWDNFITKVKTHLERSL